MSSDPPFVSFVVKKKLEQDGVDNPEFISARSKIHRGLDLLSRAA
tara:strand:+ start:342 stop:476 length:135 start_codon:yes stop_codon:yes gene_type:complete